MRLKALVAVRDQGQLFTLTGPHIPAPLPLLLRLSLLFLLLRG